MSTEDSPRRSRRSSRPSTGQTVTSVLSAEYLNKHSSKVSDRLVAFALAIVLVLTRRMDDCTALVLDVAIPFHFISFYSISAAHEMII